MKKQIFTLDLWLFLILCTLSILGLITFFSASYQYSLKNFDNPYFYFLRFVLRTTILGFLLFFIGTFLSNKFFYNSNYVLLPFFIFYLFLILTFFPYFRLYKESGRWISLKIITFQPSEIIKPFSILFFILAFSKLKRLNLNQRIIIFLLFLLFLIIPIYFQPALSNVLIISLSLFSVFVFFLSSKKELFVSILVFLGIILILVILSTLWEYRVERLLSFITKGKTYEERYFQLERSILAIKMGGLFGKGFGNSEIKNLGLPQMLTDSIFAIYAEETGFVGILFLVFLFFCLILRIILLGKKTEDQKKLGFALGVSVWIFAQTFLHLSSNSGFLIPTGVVLPFFSYGPSSQLAIYFSIGIINGFNKS